MKLTHIAGISCPDDDCPAAYLTDRGTAIIQGGIVTDPDALARLGLPAHETAVEVPISLLHDAALGLPAQ
ncbi:hypothetical protein [Tenggerimyces flavus]|uniref:Uncharacterized protein n=1 Tax=Tenggerimyces flavus TaxID=1708749 RepID=A0ABV7YKQ1_9ACTN|nr:hypothetical protein [Tenggerimyces flavus]MBM7784905.1 hypothetical protein [Tenggerimyces flavus]